MDPLDELKIEYKRLSRHINFLEKRFSPAVARDLAACLRNFVQLSDIIAQLTESNDWELKFAKDIVTKQLKRAHPAGESMSLPLPASVQSKDMQISGVSFYNHAISQEEVRALYEAGRNTRPVEMRMSFSSWLDNSAYQLKTKEGNRDISRRIFIDRGANLLGGTHPISNSVKSEYANWADPYIVDLLPIQVGLWPVPYTVLMETGQEILRVFKPYLQKS
jgi:hypothetical protein